MTAKLNSRIDWAVMWVVDGDAMTERHAEAEDAAEHVAYLAAHGVQVWIDRLEVFTEDVPDRGIAAGAEWIASSGAEPGQLWDRLPDAVPVWRVHNGAEAVRLSRRIRAVYADSWGAAREFGVAALLDPNQRVMMFGRYQTLASGTVRGGVIIHRHLSDLERWSRIVRESPRAGFLR